MTPRKFTELLEQNQTWSVIFDGKTYTPEKMSQYLHYNIFQWLEMGITFNPEEYVVCIGFNSLDYFFYTLLASVLGVKIIFCTIAQFKNFFNDYDIKFNKVISTRKLHLENATYLPLNLSENIPLFEFNKNLFNEQNQAKIIFFTSGTTNQPKLVMYQEERLLKNAEVVKNYIGIHKDDNTLCLFPTNYMYGFSTLMSTLLGGGKVFLERSTVAKAEIINYLKYKDVTVLPILQNIVEDIAPKLIQEKCFFPKLRVMNAADKIYKQHVKIILEFAPVFWNNFGQTESGPRLFSLKFEKDSTEIDQYCHQKVVAIGKTVHSHIQVRILNEKGNQCESNVIGELYYRTVFAMEGYLQKDGSLIPPPCWISSGDLVYKNEQGIIFVVGRKSQTIKVNGLFVNVNLLHTFFDHLPEIKKSYFVYDEIKNQIYAFFSIHHSVNLENLRTAIRTSFRKNFPNYPRLAEIMVIDSFPKTITGKINVNQLKQQALLVSHS